MRAHTNLGNATLEFTLVGIPLVFVLISTFEMARGMWLYHTLAHAVKEGTRYTIVRGQNSVTPATLSDICRQIVQQGPGLIPDDLTLTFTSLSGASTYTGNACPGSVWPAGTIDNQPGQIISISASYPFKSAIALFWPGAGKTDAFPTIIFPTTSSEVMQF
jgi:Flp pilus assembly protein TadG